MAGLSRFVLRHKLVVAVFWLAVLAVGVVASARLSGRLWAGSRCRARPVTRLISRSCGTTATAAPATRKWSWCGCRPAGPPPARPGGGRWARRSPRSRRGRACGSPTTPALGTAGFLTGDPRLSYGLVFTPYTGELSPPSLGPQITAAMRPALPQGSTVAVTGMNELASGGQAKEGFGVLAETLLAGSAALGVLFPCSARRWRCCRWRWRR